MDARDALVRGLVVVDGGVFVDGDGGDMSSAFPSSSSSTATTTSSSRPPVAPPPAPAPAPLASVAWVRNHYRWVVWRLAATERRCPLTCGGVLLTFARVVATLRRRYVREFTKVQLSAVRRIFERDAGG
jgi:hypothetical protein